MIYVARVVGGILVLCFIRSRAKILHHTVHPGHSSRSSSAYLKIRMDDTGTAVETEGAFTGSFTVGLGRWSLGPCPQIKSLPAHIATPWKHAKQSAAEVPGATPTGSVTLR